VEEDGKKECCTWYGSTSNRHIHESNISTMKTGGQDYVVSIAVCCYM